MSKSRILLCLKGRGIINSVRWALFAFFLLIPASLFGQTASPLTTDNNAGVSVSVSSSYQFKSHMDGGGDVSISRYAIGIGGEKTLSERIGISARLSYDRDEYSFSNANGFSVQNPWNQINRLGLNMRLRYKLNNQWSIGGGPVVQYSGENGAEFGDSMMYGGIISAVYRVNPDLTIGFGGGVFYRFEETRVFPSLIVSWKITDRLRLGNSYRLGAAGPAGLELSYKLDENWEMAAGGGHRSSRFRLDKDGPTPSGIGENRSWPVYARIGRKVGKISTLDFYGGVAFDGKMILQDSNGHDINSVSFSTAPLMGFNLSTKF